MADSNLTKILIYRPTFLSRFILYSVLISFLFPQSNSDELITKGVNAFYNYETEKAIDILSEAKEKYPEHPAVHFTWVSARWLHSQANSDVESTYRQLDEDLDIILPIYDALIEKYPDNPQYQLFYGSAIGLNARITLGKKEWISTLYHAWRGFRVIKDVYEHHPEIIDAQLPIGIVEYYAGLSNVLVKTAVTLYGLETDQEIGLAKMEEAARHGEYSWIEAQSILSFLYLWVLDSPEKSLAYSQNLAQHFPKNYYFNIIYLESLIQTGNITKAKEIEIYLKEYLKELTPIEKSWYSGYIDYESALLNYINGNFDEAETLLNRAINNYNAELDIILANIWLLKGKIHDIKGERKKAVIAYETCIELDNFSKAIILADEYLLTPFVK